MSVSLATHTATHLPTQQGVFTLGRFSQCVEHPGAHIMIIRLSLTWSRYTYHMAIDDQSSVFVLAL
jgi:hypothetical protein